MNLVSLYFGNQDISSFQDKVTKFHIKIFKQFRRHCCKTSNGVKIKGEGNHSHQNFALVCNLMNYFFVLLLVNTQVLKSLLKLHY